MVELADAAGLWIVRQASLVEAERIMLGKIGRRAS